MRVKKSPIFFTWKWNVRELNPQLFHCHVNYDSVKHTKWHDLVKWKKCPEIYLKHCWWRLLAYVNISWPPHIRPNSYNIVLHFLTLLVGRQIGFGFGFVFTLQVTKQRKWNRAPCGQQHGRLVGPCNREHLWLFGSLHIKCRWNARWPYCETSHNDAVHVVSYSLQGDHVASHLSTIRLRPARPLTDCCMPQHSPLSPQLIRWHAQCIVQWLSQLKCHKTTLSVLNNWSNRPNTTCKYKIYSIYFVYHMIYQCNLRYNLLVEGLFRYNAYFIITLFSLGCHHESYNEVAV